MPVIQGGAVTLSTPFRDTRIGERMIRADHRPFERLSVRGAKKSLIVDEAIRVRRRSEEKIAIDVSLSVRFYRTDDAANSDGLAYTRWSRL